MYPNSTHTIVVTAYRGFVCTFTYGYTYTAEVGKLTFLKVRNHKSANSKVCQSENRKSANFYY
jgi:hypothetical protein